MSVKTYETAGRGRKQCPECDSIVGVRTGVCVCGYSFKKATETAETPVEASEKEEEGVIRFTVSTPAGKCPVGLKTTKLKDVKKWLLDVEKYGRTQCDRYTIDAYKYYVRSFYNIHSDEYKKVARYIDNIMSEAHD